MVTDYTDLVFATRAQEYLQKDIDELREALKKAQEYLQKEIDELRGVLEKIANQSFIDGTPPEAEVLQEIAKQALSREIYGTTTCKHV